MFYGAEVTVSWFTLNAFLLENANKIHQQNSYNDSVKLAFLQAKFLHHLTTLYCSAGLRMCPTTTQCILKPE